MNKSVHVIGGGTVVYVRNHFALAAPAYGETARKLIDIMTLDARFESLDVKLALTRMANPKSSLESNDDVECYVHTLIADPDVKVIFFNVAMVDFRPMLVGIHEKREFGKFAPRLDSREYEMGMPILCKPTRKIISAIREKRKDIFLVGFKATCGADAQTMFTKGLRLVKEGHCNLVLVNDSVNKLNMIVTPEEASYHETTDRNDALRNLVDMTFLRSQLTFTQSTVVDGKPEPWHSDLVPDALRKVVDYCIRNNAYKPFNGATVGHFAVKLSDTEFLTSIRRANFNQLHNIGLVRIKTDGPDTVLAYGARPSVGGQSQRIVFKDHPGMDCIVHFHCPMKIKPQSLIPIRSQRAYECGSHECGKNTSSGLAQFGNLKAVYLEKHGPNIVFNRNIDPYEVINFIEANFDLDKKTGGYTLQAEESRREYVVT